MGRNIFHAFVLETRQIEIWRLHQEIEKQLYFSLYGKGWHSFTFQFFQSCDTILSTTTNVLTVEETLEIYKSIVREWYGISIFHCDGYISYRSRPTFHNQILQDKVIQQVEEFMVIAGSFCYNLALRTRECSREKREASRVLRKETRYGNWPMIKVLIFLSTRRTAFRVVLSQRTTRLLQRVVRTPLFALTMWLMDHVRNVVF